MMAPQLDRPPQASTQAMSEVRPSPPPQSALANPKPKPGSVPVSSQGVDENAIPLQQLVEIHRQEGHSSQTSTPLQYTMRAQKNDLTQQERNYIRSIASEFGGHHRFDFVSEKAKFAYRRPLPGCASKYSPPGKGEPVNSNGLQRKM